MTTFKDAKTGRRVSIAMHAWDEDKQELLPDMSYDLLVDDHCKYSRYDDCYIVPDLQYVIDYAHAWQNKEADFNPLDSDDHYERILDIEDVEDDDDDEDDEDDVPEPVKLFDEHYDEIRDKMIECYHDSLATDGRTYYTIYIWSDGEIIVSEDVCSYGGCLKPNDCETRELYHIANVHAAYDGSEAGEDEQAYKDDSLLWWIHEMLDDEMDNARTELLREYEE